MTLQQEWESYAKVLPPKCGSVQYIETRRAFYAGFLSMFEIIKRIADVDSEEGGAFKLEMLQQELNEFHEKLRKGEA
jgi:hypothetical protein